MTNPTQDRTPNNDKSNDQLHLIYQYNFPLNQIIITKLPRRLRIPLLWTFCPIDFHLTSSRHLGCICICYCCCSKMESLRSFRLINYTRLLLPNLHHFRRQVRDLGYIELPFTVESGSSSHYEWLTAKSLSPTRLERILGLHSKRWVYSQLLSYRIMSGRGQKYEVHYHKSHEISQL